MNELHEDDCFSYYTRDRSGFAEEFYQVQPLKGDIITEKDTNDALASPELMQELAGRGIRYIVTTGIFTDGCTLVTVVGGFCRATIS